jgi:hypothetical protein
MSNAGIDENSRQTLTALSNANNGEIVALWAEPGTHRLLVDAVSTANLIVGTSTITSGTNGYALYDNNGVVGEKAFPSGMTIGSAVSGGTASQLLATDGSTNLQNLAVATYPSLTEISYVKGVTSAIQTQLNGKQASGSYLTASTGVTLDQTVGQTIGATGARLTKLWATDITVTNAIAGSVTGNAGTATIVDDVASNITAYPVWVTANTGGLPLKVSSTMMNFNPSTGNFAFVSFNANNYTLNVATVTVTSNAGTVAVNRGVSNFTNSSASAMTITMATAGAVDGQKSLVRIYDFSAASKGITWVNTENNTVTAPTATPGTSTTIPYTVGFIFNGVTSKWTCVAVA